jgi:MFS family permease
MLLRGYPSEIGLLPNGTKPDPIENQEQFTKVTKLPGFTMKKIFRTEQFWFLFFTWLLHGTASSIITIHIVPHATDLGIPTVAAATVLSVLAIFNVVGGLVVGSLSDMIGRRTISIICATMGTVAMFWLMWIPNNIWFFYIFAALFGIPFGGIPTMVSALTGDMFGMHGIGEIMGWIGLAWILGAAIGPLLGGVIYDTYGRYFFAFLVGTICMSTVILLLSILTSLKTTIH